MNKKGSIVVFIVVLLFGAIGIYLTFFESNTDKYDSKVRAYKIDSNYRKGSDDDYLYYPTYYYKVNGKDYKCESSAGSDIQPNKKKNMVYYDSDNPKHCLTEYEKNTSKVAGIIFLVIDIVLIIFYVKSKDSINNTPEIEESEIVKRNELDDIITSENVEKAVETYEKIQLIITRIILGSFIIFLFIFILIDVGIVVQTIKSKDYLETTATYVETIEDKDNSEFNECKYTFLDKKDEKQEIKISFCDESRDKIKIKYNENNPQDYYEENSIMSKSGWTWFYIKLIAFALLIGLFCNKDLLKRTSVSISNN